MTRTYLDRRRRALYLPEGHTHNSETNAVTDPTGQTYRFTSETPKQIETFVWNAWADTICSPKYIAREIYRDFSEVLAALFEEARFSFEQRRFFEDALAEQLAYESAESVECYVEYLDSRERDTDEEVA